MKFKFTTPMLYAAFAIVIIVTLIIFVNTGGEKKAPETPAAGETAHMPNDDAHQGMGAGGGKADAPSKANVSKEFLEEFEGLKKAVDANPSDTLKMREYADLCAQSHKVDEAMKYYGLILKKNPKRADILLNMSYVAYSQGKFDDSKSYIERSLKIDGNNPNGLFNLGIIEAAQGKIEKARSHWEDVVKRFPKTEVANMAKDNLKRLQQAN